MTTMIPSLETPIFRFALFAALVLLIGSGAYARYLEPRVAGVTLFKRLHLFGGLLLIVGSLLDVGFTAARALGELTPYLYGAYLTRTWNGQWVMLRVVVAALLLWLALQPRAELSLSRHARPRAARRTLWLADVDAEHDQSRRLEGRSPADHRRLAAFAGDAHVGQCYFLYRAL